MSGPAGSSQWMYQAGEDYEIPYSCRFNDDDDPILTRSVTGTLSKAHTFSLWVKRGNLSSSRHILAMMGDGSGDISLVEFTNNFIRYMADGAGNYMPQTLAKFRDTSAWYHIVVKVDTVQSSASDRLKIYVNGVEQAYSGTPPPQHHQATMDGCSIGNPGDEIDGYMSEFHFIDGTALTPSSFGETGTYGEWKPKEYDTADGAYGTNGFYLDFSNKLDATTSTAYNSEWSDDSDTRVLVKSNTSDGSTTFTDTSGAYSLSANGNAHHETDQKKYGTTSMHFDGSGDYISTANSLVAFGTDDFTVEGWIYPTSTGTTQGLVSAGSDVSNGPFVRFFRGSDGYIYAYPYNSGKPWSGYLTSSIKTEQDEWSHFAFVREGDIWSVFVNGKLGGRLTGSTNYNCNSGSGSAYIGRDTHSSGFYYTGYLDEVRISDVARYTQASLSFSSTLGADASGNTNHFSPNSLTGDDQMVDTPTNNFATFNPLEAPYSSIGSHTYSEGNLQVVTPDTGSGNTFSTIGVTSGKWYAEFYIKAYTSLERWLVGVTGDLDATFQAGTNVGSLSGARDVGYMGNDGDKYVSGSESSYGSAFSVGDIIGVVLDVDNDTVNFYHNNVAKGTISISSTGTWHIGVGDVSGGGGGTIVANFGQDSSFAGNKTAQGNQDGNEIGDFYYEPPTDYLALCTSNLPAAAVKPQQHFNTVLYTGNESGQSIDVGFQSDLVWMKSRSEAHGNAVIDAVRGADANWLYTNTDDDEFSEEDNQISFDSDGFDLLTGYNVSNDSGQSYVAWNWKAGGSGSSNTDGSITSTVSANQDAGFSIVSWTGNGSSGATIGHGLSSAPEMFISKSRDSAEDWGVYTLPVGATKALFLDRNIATDTGSQYYNDTTPSATLITLGTGAETNVNNDDYIGYAFHSVDGYSKVGTYKSNNSTDGPFVYLGFQPKFILCKGSSFASDWTITDNERESGNPFAEEILFANDNLVETNYTGGGVDFLSNGFKVRSTGTNGTHNANTAGYTFIYIAFAETPFKYANAR